MRSFPVRPLLGLLVVIPLAALLACSRDGEQARDETFLGAPVVLISIDTLRSDRLPAYGYRGVVTPALDRLRRDGILFESIFSPAPLTLPAHASLFSGLIPPLHGVRDNLGYRFDPDRGLSLTRALKDLGYATGGFVSAFVLRASMGLADGFDVYEDDIPWREASDMGGMQRSGQDTVRKAVSWLDGQEGGPFFLFLHLYEPHSPYSAPEPFASRFDDPYDAEVAAADAVVGTLLGALESKGLYDDSLIVVLSDHGEGLMDHGEQEHGLLLYREALQVPLLLKLPANHRAGESRPENGSLVDVAPTILALLGQAPPENLSGIALLQADPDSLLGRTVYAETQYPRLHFGWSPLRSAIQGPWHLIEGAGTAELYDLIADPAETRDLRREERREASRLLGSLQSIPSDVTAPTAEDEATRRELAALGYVGVVGASDEDDLPHPKTRLHVLKSLHEAYEAYRTGEYARAIPIFRATLEEEPRLVDAWEHLGACLVRTGDLEGAWSAYEKALQYSGGASSVALSAAGVLLDLGRPDMARKHAELALDTQPFAHAILARIDLLENRLDDAREHAAAALQVAAGRDAEVRLLLAEIEAKAGNPEATLEALQRLSRTEDPSQLPRGFHVLEGEAFAALGDAAAAHRSFRTAIERHPEDLAAYTRLALLAALQGDNQGAASALREMVESNPEPGAYVEAVRTLDTLGDPASATRLLAYAAQRWPDEPSISELASERAGAAVSSRR